MKEAREWAFFMGGPARPAALVLALLLAFWAVLAPAAAVGDGGERMVVPLGRAVGIKLFSDGVIVVGMSDIDTGNGTANPAKACGLQTGDIITHINGRALADATDLTETVEASGGKPLNAYSYFVNIQQVALRNTQHHSAFAGLGLD